jgi:hypothetical protein
MSDDAVKPVPSIDDLVMFYRRWEGLRRRGERGPSTRWEQETWEHEKQIMEHWGPLSDLIRSMPPKVGAFSGWPGYIDNFCGVLVEVFEKLTKSWGWEGLDQPKPGRTAEVEGRDRRFTEAIEPELMGSAISWSSGWEGNDFHKEAAKWAEKARERGITPTMPPDDAEAKFDDALRRHRHSPRLGTAIPWLKTIGDDVEVGDRGKLELGLVRLREELLRQGVPKEKLSPWEPGQGAGQASETMSHLEPARAPSGDKPQTGPSDESRSKRSKIERRAHILKLVEDNPDKPFSWVSNRVESDGHVPIGRKRCEQIAKEEWLKKYGKPLPPRKGA